MAYQRLAYDDHDPAHEMRVDCTACASRIELPQRRRGEISEAATMPAPSLEYAEFPREVAKRSIEVSDAAAHLASRLHLHLD